MKADAPEGFLVHIKLSQKPSTTSLENKGWFDKILEHLQATGGEAKYLACTIAVAKAQYCSRVQATASNPASVRQYLWSPLLPMVEAGELKIRSVPGFKNAQLILREEDHLNSAPKVRTVSSFWIHGPAGTGKSIRAIAAFPEAYTKPPQDIYFNGYLRHEAVILHELSVAQLGQDARPNITQFLKNWSDVGNQHRLLSIKGAYTPAFYHIFIVTSNFSLQEIFKSKEDQADLLALSRRFRQFYIGPQDKGDSVVTHQVTGVSIYLPSFADALTNLSNM